MTHHFDKIVEEEKAKKGNTGIVGKTDFDEINKDKNVGEERKSETKVEEGEKVKEFDFKGSNLNKVGIKSASDTNAIDGLQTTVANVATDLEVKLADSYEKVKALKIKFASKRGPFEFKINDSDKVFKSKVLKDNEEVFELDEPIQCDCVCIKPVGDKIPEIVDIQVFVEGDPNSGHDNRNPPQSTGNGNNNKKKGAK